MPEGMPFTLSVTMTPEGSISGTISSPMGSLPIESASFSRTGADSGTLKFGISPPGGGPVSFTLAISADSLTGTGAAGPMSFDLSGKRSSRSALAADEEEEEPPTDIPEKLGLPFGAYALESIPEQLAWLEIRGATIWTCGPAGVIPNGTLIARSGKIDYVGPSYTGERPAGAVEVDLPPGRHITPGLIDCHSHTGISRGVNESGQAVTAEVRIQDVTDPDSMSWYWQLAGGITAVNNLHGSANPIGGQNCVNKNRWGAVHPDDLHFQGAPPGIKFALGENVKQSNWGDTFTSRYPKSRMGVETLIRDRFIAAREYAAQRARGGAAVRRDLELEALAEILEGTRLVHCHSYRQDEILMLCRVADDFAFRIGTFQHILEGYKVADEVRDHSIGGSAFSDWWAYKVEVQDAIPYAGAIMHDVGVCVSFNSDSDELARRMNVEAGKAVRYGGVPTDEALRFVSLNPAKQLKVDAMVGSLEPGKDADFAIWAVPIPSQALGKAGAPAGKAALSGGASSERREPNDSTAAASAKPPPLAESPLSTLALCEATYIDGRCYFSLELDQQLREKNSAERQRLLQKLLASQSKKEKDAKPDEGRPDAKPEEKKPESPPWETGGAAGRDSLMYSMLQRAAEARREYFLDLLRRGIDPATARCGDCGESLLGLEASR
jgi:imidazolonepropionase-like amidohydrolase